MSQAELQDLERVYPLRIGQEVPHTREILCVQKKNTRNREKFRIIDWNCVYIAKTGVYSDMVVLAQNQHDEDEKSIFFGEIKTIDEYIVVS